MQNEDPNAFGGPTMTIEDKIKLFAELSGDERREVEHYVESHGDEHPHLKQMLRDSKRLARLLESARTLGEEPPGEEALAFYAVMQSIDPSRMPAEHLDALNRIRASIDANPALQGRLQEIEQRGIAIEQASDAEAQFARLAKTPLAKGSDGATRRGPETSREAGAHRRMTSGSEERKSRTPVARSRLTPNARPVERPSLRRTVRRAAVGAAAAAVVYAGLFFAGRAIQPDHERIAHFGSDELLVEGFEGVRGDGVQSLTDPAAAYIQALGQLQEAQTSTLGLFPRFQDARLDSAAVLLRQVMDNEPEDSFLATEAQYFLAKTELARGNVTEARSLLQQVAETPGVRAGDAQQLLQRVSNL